MCVTIKFVVQNTALHPYKCAEGNFIVFDGVSSINQKCSDLKYSTTMKNIEERAVIKDVSSLRINNKYMTHQNLSTKIENLQKEKWLLTIENVCPPPKKMKIGKSLSFHKRFLISVNNDIPRLQSIVKLALRNKRCVEYVLDKCTQRVSYQDNNRNPCTNKTFSFLM